MKQKLRFSTLVFALFLLLADQRAGFAKAEVSKQKPKSSFLSTLLGTDKDGKPRKKRQCGMGRGGYGGGWGGGYGGFGGYPPPPLPLFPDLGGLGLGGLGGIGIGGGLSNLLPLIIDAGAERIRKDETPEVIVVTVPVHGRMAAQMDVTPSPKGNNPDTDNAESLTENSKYHSKITNYGVNVVPKAGDGYPATVSRDYRGQPKVGLGHECQKSKRICMDGMQCAGLRTGHKLGKYCQCIAPLVESENKKYCVSPYGPPEK